MTVQELTRAIALARHRRRLVVGGAVVLLADAVAFIAWVPVWLGFGAAVAAAMTWCRWLELSGDPLPIRLNGRYLVRNARVIVTTLENPE